MIGKHRYNSGNNSYNQITRKRNLVWIYNNYRAPWGFAYASVSSHYICLVMIWYF